jgi:hypothetical protein
MEKIGDGENVRETEKLNMVEPSTHSQKNEKRSTKKTKPITTPAEAARLLKSALWYCLDAGLIVEGYNDGNRLILEIVGLAYADEEIIVTPTSVTSVTSEK